MADKVFADTAGWASLFVQTEPHYHTARAWFDGWFKPGVVMITTNYVLAEWPGTVSLKR
jgi:hypothetical protein